MTHVLPRQVELQCNARPVSGGSDGPTAILRKLRRQIRALEEYLSNLDVQVRQGWETLSAFKKQLDELPTTAADEDVNSDIRRIKQKVAENECGIIRNQDDIETIHQELSSMSRTLKNLEANCYQAVAVVEPSKQDEKLKGFSEYIEVEGGTMENCDKQTRGDPETGA